LEVKVGQASWSYRFAGNADIRRRLSASVIK
jgi:hypothetical protein